MSPTPRWWKRALIITVLLLALDAAVFVAAWGPDLLGWPAGNNGEFWLGAGVLSEIIGLVLIAFIFVLLLLRWIKSSGRPSASNS